LEIKTNLSHLTLHATLESRDCLTGMTEKGRQCRLQYPCNGASRRIITMTAIFVWSTLPVTIRKTKKELNIQISYQLGQGEYDPSTWCLFIDSSKRSLKAVLLHNRNVLASVPLAHSTKLSKSYETLELVLEKIKYHKHEWRICGDLKVIGLLLGLQRGYTKCPCFLCE
jgi:hypothetical protein